MTRNSQVLILLAIGLAVPGTAGDAAAIGERSGEFIPHHSSAEQPAKGSTMDQQFERLAARFLDEFPALSPVGATLLGDHRFDGQLDEVSPQARQRQTKFCKDFLASLDGIDGGQLNRDNQVDYRLLGHHLRKRLWQLERLEEWTWNPLVYTRLAGSSIYGLMARDFAPIEQRLVSVAARLEQLPRLYRQIRETLVPQRVPAVHAETAVKQNRGLLSILDNMVRPYAQKSSGEFIPHNVSVGKLSKEAHARLIRAIQTATAAVEEHQKWLETELVPHAAGEFRIGPKLYDEKLALTLETKMTRAQIRELARSELRRVRQEMYEIAQGIYHRRHPKTEFPKQPSREHRQQIISACLEMAYAETPDREEIVPAARKSLDVTTSFVRNHDLVTIPPDPLEIIIMPEFERGVSVAYCDSPGPLEVGQKTFYAVAPLPGDWTEEQCRSFLREYNLRSIHNLTVHEAMPGHFLQIAHANHLPRKLRAVLSSGVFVEGWACYTEQMMSEEGFLDGDPLMRLVTLKWYLRSIGNALLDQAIHVDGMQRDEAMKLMTEDTFQEEREAAGKWTRAQLTSVQLSTYFVGYQEHRQMRRAAKKAWGDDFSLKRYHDGVISFGSPPTRYVRALLLDEPIPE